MCSLAEMEMSLLYLTVVCRIPTTRTHAGKTEGGARHMRYVVLVVNRSLATGLTVLDGMSRMLMSDTILQGQSALHVQTARFTTAIATSVDWAVFDGQFSVKAAFCVMAIYVYCSRTTVLCEVT